MHEDEILQIPMSLHHNVTFTVLFVNNLIINNLDLTLDWQELIVKDSNCDGLTPVTSLGYIYMEGFERKVLHSAPLKPKCWFRYIDDTFTNLVPQTLHGGRARFLEHLSNGVHTYGYQDYHGGGKRWHATVPKCHPTVLYYVKGCTDRISRLLKKLNINTVFTTMKKINGRR
ncbi:hypothetical protein NQ315_016124 [Exocentrus adspersus]|uniref:Uncharacterized protein n=1 Tax=Exocentrus adspersus TaxID=1586481 RepID=A0AAV8VC55_9CUCU|nr:hypothetical protein NQ315_016124 [Exocentrus adspersus]